MDERFILVDKHLSGGGGGHMEPDDQGDWVRLSDLAAARAEIERLTKERDHDALTREGILQKRINDLLARAEKAEAERDEARAERDALMADPLYIIGVNHGWDEAVENDVAHPAARSMLADAERDMRQRAAKVAREAWRDGYDAAPHILALPLKHADREGGS